MARIFIIACEASGDKHGADLVRAILRMDPTVRFEGLGGMEMKKSGVELLEEMTRVSVLGFSDVLRKYFHFRRIFYRALARVRETRPDLIILIDSPAFNLRFAKKISAINRGGPAMLSGGKKKIPVVYYISPQIWAWGGRRIHTIRKTVDHMMVILPFEEEIYKKAGIPCTFVGHPLLDRVRPSRPRPALREEFGISGPERAIALLPGSREPEVRRILPIMLETARILQKEVVTPSPSPLPLRGGEDKGEGVTLSGALKFFMTQAPHVPVEIYDSILERFPDVKVRKSAERLHDVVKAADFALVASGTATLETALIGTPFFLLYKASASTFFLGRRLVRLPYIGLVNVLAGRHVVPEFIQHLAQPDRIAQETKKFLGDESLRENFKRDIQEVLTKLGEPGASERAARLVMEKLRSRAPRAEAPQV